MAEVAIKPEVAEITASHDVDLDKKRKSKSPALVDVKRTKVEKDEDADVTEDIAKQYKKFQNAPKFNLNSEELFCVCRRPDHGGELMIGCDGCEEWFHFTCMKMNQENQLLIDKFFCKFCQWQGKGYTRYMRICRLPSCMNPIRLEQKSKYCSDECGLKYMSKYLEELESLSKSGIKFAITYCKTRDELAELGAKFPELPEVANKNLDSFPEEIKQQLRCIEDKTKDIKKELEHCSFQQKYLTLRKELLKKVNEALKDASEKAGEEEEDEAPKKKKKLKKAAKFDLCGFDASLYEKQLLEFYQSAVEDSAKTIEEGVQDLTKLYNAPQDSESANHTCLQDRRKCLRHNGWWNLISDGLWKRLIELEDALVKLENEKQDTLREYSIQVYERDS